MKRFAQRLGAALLLAAAAALTLGPGLVQGHLNKVIPRPAYAASAAAQALHKRLWPQVDHEYSNRWAGALSVEDLLEPARAEADPEAR